MLDLPRRYTVLRYAGIPLVLACTLICLSGCGDEPQASVKGQIVYKKASVKNGTVNFLSPETGAAGSARIEGGQFACNDPLKPGKYAVFVLPPTSEPVDPRKGKARTIASAIPKKAQDLNTSGVTVEVKPGANDLTIELRD